jgi:hypothetical protein
MNRRPLVSLASVCVIMVSAGLVFSQTVTTFDYDGAKLTLKGPDHEEYRKPDGTRIMKYADREQAHLNDGTVIVKYGNGDHHISCPDGTQITIRFDGTRRYVYKDGRERLVSLDGKTPYGAEIPDVERTVGKGDAQLKIVYSGMLSDDILDGQARQFFNDLVSTAASKIEDVPPAVGEGGKVVVSLCRFCKTGYCRRKDRREIEIVVYRGGVERGRLSMVYSDLANKEKRSVFIDRACGVIFEKEM